MKKSNFYLPLHLLKNKPTENQNYSGNIPKVILSFFYSHPLFILMFLGGFLLLLLKINEGQLSESSNQVQVKLTDFELISSTDKDGSIGYGILGSKSPHLVPKPVPLPANGIDAFGLPVQGTFLIGSSFEDQNSSLSDLASSIPIQGFMEGKEVIIGNRVFHPGDVFLLRTPAQLQKIKVIAIECDALILQDQAGTEIRVPWPRVILDEYGVYGEIQINHHSKGQSIENPINR
ncbi:hypothetical protein IT6_01010 [Methylacidiphilum caldifontis]|uniref:hypothetical protein n=1 Tax=Methylacidiphilum caldifontis TaxID=2795386 RepID=UPI001A8CA9BA|nr:hypothetical protein [Methylacidiphilum caldifontis]QSR88918.1 hypothetical protein IT6_01010 [Methylacidiphilum caldifontis]